MSDHLGDKEQTPSGDGWGGLGEGANEGLGSRGKEIRGQFTVGL